jgi:hypothetical protein
MTFPGDTRIERHDRWLIIYGEGTHTLAWMIDIARATAELVQAERPDAVLFELSAANVDLSFIDRFRLGLAGAKYLDGAPFAFVADKALVDPGRFGEMVARNRGVDVRAFTERAPAEEWLRARVAERASWKARRA